MGFEPTRAEHKGLAVHRLNHSATSSCFHDFSSKRMSQGTAMSQEMGLVEGDPVRVRMKQEKGLEAWGTAMRQELVLQAWGTGMRQEMGLVEGDSVCARMKQKN
ncbi:hypothetical protein NQZ68_009404 [Dissostichus eleginoides]|nr:hypothetical protein NQZ68_009404 [Dissostichus eleginoides]